MRTAQARLFLLLAAALLPALPLCAAKMTSASFSDLNGIPVFGSAAMASSNFVSYGSLQDVAVSTQQTAGFSSRAGKLAYFPPPAAVPNLEVVTVSSSQVRITWTAPAADVSRNTGAANAYVLRYTTAAFIGTDQAFSNSSSYAQAWTPLAAGSAETRVLEGFNPGTTYYFSIEALNDHGLLAEISNPAVAYALVPLAPMNFKAARAGQAVNLTWIPPAGYQNRIPFDNRFSPAYPYEVRGYQIFKATAPAGADWQFLAEVSSNTFNWNDPVPAGEEYYYYARAVNQAGASRPSYARDSLSGSLYFLAPDNESMLEVTAAGTSAFFAESGDPMKTYSVEISTHPEDLGGRVVKSVQFRAYRGGLQADDSFRLPAKGTLKLFYTKTGTAITPSAASDAKAVSMYFYNGSRWLQMFGSVDEAARSVQLETTLMGRYQLRTTERTGGFSADQAGLTNRLITPNGDGKNDTMVFIFDNPQEQEVKGRIYDMRGALVARMKPGPVGNSVIWDAKAGGQAVPGGVYIYQIEAQGKVYNGTVAVIR